MTWLKSNLAVFGFVFFTGFLRYGEGLVLAVSQVCGVTTRGLLSSVAVKYVCPSVEM